jgi:hypothetical protein
MKTEDQVIKLVAKKMAGEATDMELQKLNDLFEKDAGLYKALALLLADKTVPDSPPDDRSRILFEKIKARISNDA